MNNYIRGIDWEADKPPFFWNNMLQASRFGETLRILQDKLDSKNFYAFNPSFDTGCGFE